MCEERLQFFRRDNLKLSEGAGSWFAVGAPAAKMGHVAKASALHVLVGDFDDEFRRDYQTNYASAGGSYEDYQPAYRGGYESRYDSRFANRSWDEAEPELRQRWESEHPGSAWERMKAAVRRGWDKATT